MRKRIKMVEVARQAQVSQTTVSLVLNNVQGIRITEETRRRVIDTARELGYSPGPMLAELESGAPPVVGVLINEISAAYPIDIIDGLHMAARTQGLQLAIFVTDGVLEREALALKSLRRLSAGGVIYATTFSASVHPTPALQAFPHVYVNCTRQDGKGVAVIPAEQAAGFAAARHLIGQGCKRIATITGDSWHISAQRRLKGFIRGLQSAGMTLEPSFLQPADFQHKSGTEAMRALLALPTPPDGVFCHNDPLARGALEAIAEAGLRVPGDIAVLGFDDREFAKDLGLSTMLLPHGDLGERAMAMLVQNKTEVPVTLNLRCPLIARASTQRVSARGMPPREGVAKADMPL